MKSRDLEHFRRMLLDKRVEVLGDLNGLQEEAAEQNSSDDAVHMPDHLGERAASSWNEDLVHRLAENERDLILEIDRALERIDDGSYGICEVTGKPIPKQRLEAKPWARRTIEAERDGETGSAARDDRL